MSLELYCLAPKVSFSSAINNTEYSNMSITGAKIANSSPVSISVIGLGTFNSEPEQENRCEAAVVAALQAGYRFIDAVALYGCEEEVRRGIRKSGVPREEVVLCTKL